jgi:hypothetical protein
LRGDAADDDLALAQREMALVEQAAAAEPLEQARVTGENRTSGGTPGDMMRSRNACRSGAKGGSSGARRADMNALLVLQ